MTVWEHLVTNSTLAEADGDAWEHLTNPSGEGGGTDRLVPYDSLELNIKLDRMDVNIEKRTLNIDMKQKELSVDFGIKVQNINIEKTNKEVKNGCS